MRIQTTAFTVAEILGMFGRQELVVNETYQRNPGIWPPNAKSYFIDTILTEYSFPKVYFFESYDRKLKKIKREIVDGQQRLTTIKDFASDQFALTKTSAKFQRKRFSDLDEDTQAKFMSYSVPVDNILSATSSEILEMFRRMNSLTVKLNPAEKRHSGYLGPFKWFINELADYYSPMLENFGVLTQKQILRMADAELLLEVVQLFVSGIVNKQDKTLDDLYKTHDKEFPQETELRARTTDVLNFVRDNLGQFSKTFLFKGYVFYSLCAALIHNKFGLPPAALDGVLGAPTGKFWIDGATCIPRLRALVAAHEGNDNNGIYAEYVDACASTTHRVAQRTTRTVWLLKALNGTLEL
jgi:uncharacterized protein DUF262